MAKNTLQLTVNGETHTLQFNIGTFNIVRDLTGQDPFLFQAKTTEYDDVIRWAKVILHASLMSNHKSEKVVRKYSDEELDAILEGLSLTDLGLITNLWQNPVDNRSAVDGEVNANTQGDHLG